MSPIYIIKASVLLLCLLFFVQTSAILRFNKRNEVKLCPIEYQSCVCNYTSANRFSNNPDQIEYNSNVAVALLIDCRLDSQFSAIPKISFSNQANRNTLQHISQIDLSRTSINTIQTDAFHGLVGLKTIIITYCEKLKKIEMFAFRNLPILKTLIISNNINLVSLEPHSLGSLRNLNYLSLSMNNLRTIDGYVFSSSTSIKRISFIGNPIRKVKSHAFHGLKNVTDLMISFNQNVAPIDSIEGDAFISLAFVDQIFLDGIPLKKLLTNTFRGLSYCKSLHLSNTYIEEIDANAFFRANHIDQLNLKNSRIRDLHKDAFSGMFSINNIDLSGNYIKQLTKDTFQYLIPLEKPQEKTQNYIDKTSITLIEERKSVQPHLVNKIILDQNPIQCDCSLDWLINNNVAYSSYISLPEICAGPRGFDCLRVADLSLDKLACNEYNKELPKVACQDLEFSYNETQSQIVNEIFSIQKEDGKKQFIDKFVQDDSNEYDYDYNEDDYYYTVEKVQQEDLKKYEKTSLTSTSTKKQRKQKTTNKISDGKNAVMAEVSNKKNEKEDKQAEKIQSHNFDISVNSTANNTHPSFLKSTFIFLFLLIVNKLSFL